MRSPVLALLAAARPSVGDYVGRTVGVYDSIEQVAEEFGEAPPPTAVRAANRRRAADLGFAGVQNVQIDPPTFDAEEEFARPLAAHLRCDACHAFAHQTKKRLFEATDGRERALDAAARIDFFAALCREALDDYGVKEIADAKGWKRNRLSGPGTEADYVTAMMTGGGPWPGRLRQRCGEIVGDVGEDALYAMWLRDGKELTNTVCVDATGDCDVRVDPPKVKVTAPRGGAFERKFRKPPKKKKKKDDAEL